MLQFRIITCTYRE